MIITPLIPILPLLIAGMGTAVAGATAGAIGSAVNNKRAQDERTRAYNAAKSNLELMKHESMLDSVGGRSALKLQNERREEQLRGMENRAVAGGATFENQLAARNAINRTDNELSMRLLQYDDAHRQGINQQKLALDQNYSNGVQQSFYQNALNWQNWGQQLGNAGMSLANAGLLSK